MAGEGEGGIGVDFQLSGLSNRREDAAITSHSFSKCPRHIGHLCCTVQGWEIAGGGMQSLPSLGSQLKQKTDVQIHTSNKCLAESPRGIYFPSFPCPSSFVVCFVATVVIFAVAYTFKIHETSRHGKEHMLYLHSA